MSNRAPSTFGNIVAAAIYFPIGLGAKLVDDLPRRIAAIKDQIDTARSRADHGIGSQIGLEQREDAGEPPSHSVPARPDVRGAADSTGESQVAAAGEAMAELALADYDHLPASHIVAKLDGLTPAELEAIRRHEVDNRGRRTVLGKIDQLVAGS